MLTTERKTPVYPHKLRRLYWPFLALAEGCRDVVGTVAGSFNIRGRRYTIPRFTFLGPATNRPQQRVGLFALLRGDEPAGANVLLRLLETLVAVPRLAAGYDLVCYPVCNPTGYEDNTRATRGGTEIIPSLWQGARAPEVRILEAELRGERFNGLITLAANAQDAAVAPPPDSAPRPFELVAPTPRDDAPADDAASAHLFIQVALDAHRERALVATEV